MAYTKHTWKERLGTGLNKFKDTITNTVMALVNQPDSVTQQGTPIRADWLNEMEEGIYQAHVTADAALPKTGKAADSDKLDGKTLSLGLEGDTVALRTPAGYLQATGFREDGYDLADLYLGKTAKAADSDKLDGKDSSDFATSGHYHDTRYYGLTSNVPGDLNLDNLKTAGLYHSNATAFTNGPPSESATSYALVIVKRRPGSDTIVQELYCYSGTRYTRIWGNGKWDYWYCNTILWGSNSPPSKLGYGQIYIQY